MLSWSRRRNSRPTEFCRYTWRIWCCPIHRGHRSCCTWIRRRGRHPANLHFGNRPWRVNHVRSGKSFRMKRASIKICAIASGSVWHFCRMFSRKLGVGQLDEGLQGPGTAFVCQVVAGFFLFQLSLFPENRFLGLVKTALKVLRLLMSQSYKRNFFLKSVI